MNTATNNIDSRIRSELIEEFASARVVIYSSSLTDTRALVIRLAYLNIPYREIRLTMGSSRNRKKYEMLRALTQWPYLPQIFMDGSFVGGAKEFVHYHELSEKQWTLQ